MIMLFLLLYNLHIVENFYNYIIIFKMKIIFVIYSCMRQFICYEIVSYFN